MANEVPSPETQADDFDSLLSLESQYYNEGYTLGLADGSQAGRTEGRLFGLEKGFAKALELGRLSGKAAMYQARITKAATSRAEAGAESRAGKQIIRLVELTDITTISTENDEESVTLFDERMRDAKAKARLVERLMGTNAAGQGSVSGEGERKAGKVGTGEMEDFTGLLRSARQKPAEG